MDDVIDETQGKSKATEKGVLVFIPDSNAY